MKLAIMQPYFMPYIGYWQLMNAVDKFVVYDNIEYTKKGWFNRNRILLNGKDYLFTIPIKKASDYLDVCERFIARDFNNCKFLNIFKEAYRKAPYFNVVFPVLQNIVKYEDDNLFNYIYHSISQIRDYLGITNDIVVSSSIKINHELKGKDKVMALCKELGATDYYNSIGGQSLYDKAEFEERGINLSFLKSKLVPYKQFNNDFVPGLSIVDVMMFNSIDEVHRLINEYQLI
jgi:hypothetical protein